eukprot:CAMPEP_0181066770 /NCGR_PEP_ID=MMETSP1070-20121207/25516_1 /TAXON_ID=265543 /ORGANISM="Minutocellus polymorphus, Strain NH13" /LENGTH=807 /DNA_ID=CAMNT_0023147383 /DNA_START=47 /DNA_END=2470 /DNA_ORIENTATION=-
MPATASSVQDDAAAFNAAISRSVDITDAYLRNGILTLTRSARDVDSNSRRRLLYNIPITSLGSSVLTPPTEIPTKVKARIPSPSGNKVAILVEEPIAKNGEDARPGDTRTTLEIWADNGHSLTSRIVLSKDLHGKLSTDVAWFGGFSWNAEETALVYAAEAKLSKTASFFDEKKKDDEKPKGDNERADSTGGQFTLGVGKGEDWGEKYTGTSRLALFCANVETGKVDIISNVPGGVLEENSEGGYTLGQPVFTPCGKSVVYVGSCGKSVVYVGWDAGGGGSMPRRLGSIYCYQRPAKLYSSSVTQLLERLSSTKDDGSANEKDDEDFACLTPDDSLARSPRFSPKTPDGTSKLVYLCNTPGFDTHGGCMELHSLDWDVIAGSADINTRRILVKEVRLPSDNDAYAQTEKIGDMSFPGIFTNQLPTDCFSEDGEMVYMTTQWGSISKAIQISVEAGTIEPLKFALSSESGEASQAILGITKEGAIVAQSDPGRPMTVGFMSPNAVRGGDKATCVSLPRILAAAATSAGFSASDVDAGLTYQVINMRPSHGKVKAPVQGILLIPDNSSPDQKLPLIVVPHGGPHSCTSTGYVPSYAYLCSHGKYAILHVNYRGSSGFGQDALESLAGTAGDLDVKDCVHATEHALDLFPIIDPDRVGFCGGSHGGYLAGHCTGQYPELFKVAAMRNPVTNIATMTTATDIVDWCAIETFGVGSYDWKKYRGPDREELGAMWDASPIAHIKNVKAPTLVALGMSDRRVPPSQGLEYYHSLRSKRIATKLLVYEHDDHAIDRVVSEADHWINIKRWFDEHL